MDGILIVNKPKDVTSHDVVSIVRKSLQEKKVGHAGTLDPKATGVLPILIGKGTKLSKYLIEHNKEYIAVIKFGIQTDTGDSEGQIIRKDNSNKNLNKEKVEEVLQSFLGKQKQTPPIYSSIKINGKKAYEYARKGEKIVLAPRDTTVYNIELLALSDDELKFRVSCSKGTYIRSLCEDIAGKCGTIGYMKELTRTKVDDFYLENSVTIDELKNDTENIKKRIISIEELFKGYEAIELDNRKKELFLNGVSLTFNLTNDIYRVYNNKIFLGLGTINNNLLKRDVIL